jgi:hypothetical protein
VAAGVTERRASTASTAVTMRARRSIELLTSPGAQARVPDPVFEPSTPGFGERGRRLRRSRERRPHMLAALNMGIVGTIIVVAIVIALALFFLRRTA